MEISVILIQKEKRKKGKAQGKAQDSKQKKKKEKKKEEKKKTPCRIRTPALSPEDLSFSAPHTLGNLSTDVFETRTATGRRKQMPLACSDLNQSVGKPFFSHFKVNDTD